jgi:signal transduction histidine kinase
VRAFAQSIVETVRHPLLVLDAGLRVRTANPAYHAAFGIHDGRTEEADLCDIPGLRDRLKLVATTGQGFEGFEAQYSFPPTGPEPKTLLLSARRVVSEVDASPMILLAIEDVTEKRLAEGALGRLNDELEARVRQRTTQLEAANAEMEAFCYSVSHDLRAPLRAIDGFARELLQDYADRVDETGRHYLQRVRANSQRMAQLLDDLLQLSRLSRSEMAVGLVDVTALAHEVAAELRQREPDRRVDLRVEPGLTARGDARLLRVALENLLGNAWKFTSKKAEATVEVGRRQDDSGLAFYVRDDGAGFDPQYASKLFGAFQRLHHEREFPGTGIGLAIVQRVVHRHGGRVWAEGAVGMGATFSFTLPDGDGS